MAMAGRKQHRTSKSRDCGRAETAGARRGGTGTATAATRVRGGKELKRRRNGTETRGSGEEEEMVVRERDGWGVGRNLYDREK